MKTLYYFILSFFFISVIFCQNQDSTFSELKGMEDQNGNTHLFYRLYSTTGNTMPGGYANNIYHLDLSKSIDSLFIYSSVWEDSVSLRENIVNDIEFWHNDPSEFIYSGFWGSYFENGSYIRKYNKDFLKETIFYSGMGRNIEISKQNDSLLYSDGLNKSTDGGNNWIKLNLPYYSLVSVSPYNDNEIYVLDNNYILTKTSDACKTFAVVDSLSNISAMPTLNLYYDRDSLHIYNMETINGSYKLFVSNKNGEAGSWLNKYSGSNSIYPSVDYSKSGTIYLAENKNIFISTDYGDTFNLYRSLDSIIVGIYNKPGSDILYAATKHDIYEVTSTSVKSIKYLSVSRENADYYPLHVGDIWIFSGENRCVTWGNPSDMVHVRKVIDKVEKSNNKTYFEIKEEYYFSNTPGYYFERVDTSSGKIFRYSPDSTGTNFEYLIDDITALKGDTVFSYRFGRLPGSFIITKESDTTFINKTTKIKTYLAGGLETWEYKLAEGLGLVEVSRGDDNECFTSTLQGAVINGIVYGDTTLTDVINKKNVPFSFALYQNYPNPFNPSTTITYEIPKSGLVQLKIFDILGREVSGLVNENQSAGKHTVLFDSQQTHKQLSSGVYFFRLKFGSNVLNKKMVLLR